VASLSQGRTAAAQCGLFTYKSVPVIFEPPCTYINRERTSVEIKLAQKRACAFRWTEKQQSVQSELAQQRVYMCVFIHM